MSKQRHAQAILLQAGYNFQIGAAGKVHVQVLRQTKYGRRVPRGQPAVCGQPAARHIRDIDAIQDADLCQVCLRKILKDKE